jgi:hypothetical protein
VIVEAVKEALVAENHEAMCDHYSLVGEVIFKNRRIYMSIYII